MTAKTKPKTILITGGCGFIGTNLVTSLSRYNYDIKILDNFTSNSKAWSNNNGHAMANHKFSRAVKLHSLTSTQESQYRDILVGDIRDSEIVNKSVEGVYAVVHLAAHAGVLDSLKNPKNIWEVNVNGTLNILESCRKKGVNTFIFASSNAAVGEHTPPIDENKIPRPISPYGASKLTGEALCSAYYNSFGLKTVCLRFANCYGPYSEHKTSVIRKFINWAKRGEPLVIYGDGNQTRDFIHVDDVCQAIHLALTSDNYQLPATNTLAGEVFQIASGVETSINELTGIIKELTERSLEHTDYPLSIVHKPKRKGEIERNYSDITKAKKLLGFEPKINLRQGIEELFQSYDLKNQEEHQ